MFMVRVSYYIWVAKGVIGLETVAVDFLHVQDFVRLVDDPFGRGDG